MQSISRINMHQNQVHVRQQPFVYRLRNFNPGWNHLWLTFDLSA